MDAATGTDAEILQALDDLRDHPAGEEGFQQAVDALRKKLVGTADEREAIKVPIDDQQWLPRPTDADLREHFPELAKHLMVRSGLLSFAGVMTQAEAKTLFGHFTPVAADLGLATAPDQRACEELFGDAFNSGLDGARIEVRTRRGSARMISREVEAMIDRGAPAPAS